MSDTIQPSFEHSFLESDLAHLAREVAERKESFERVGTSDKEILREAIKSFGTAPVSNAQSADDTAKGPLPLYVKDAPPETKLEIEYLLDVAVHKGIAVANSEAKRANPYILDAFHDALLKMIHPVMEEKKLL
ncbi:MAG: hypothetical protein Q7S28_01090 [bacterium]|nr:hypothetical protein [bacterium]